MRKIVRPRKTHKTTWNLWEQISPEAKVKLAKLYKKLSGEDFMPPHLKDQNIITEFKLESTEEIDRLIRQPRGR